MLPLIIFRTWLIIFVLPSHPPTPSFMDYTLCKKLTWKPVEASIFTQRSIIWISKLLHSEHSPSKVLSLSLCPEKSWRTWWWWSFPTSYRSNCNTNCDFFQILWLIVEALKKTRKKFKINYKTNKQTFSR